MSIEVRGITKLFGSYTAVDNVSLEIAPGRLTVLKGPSGSGKTTLLALIGCMARPSSGRITLQGSIGLPGTGSMANELEITSLPERFLTEVRRRRFGFVFQQFNLLKGISVLENIMLPAYPLGENAKVLQDRAHETRRRQAAPCAGCWQPSAGGRHGGRGWSPQRGGCCWRSRGSTRCCTWPR